MLFAAIALFLAAQDARTPPHERGAGVVVMLGIKHNGDVPELRAPPSGQVSISARHLPPEDLGESEEFNVHSFELVPGAFRAADDPSIARAVRTCERVTFGAGTLREWYLELFPNHHKSELVHALLEARRFGTTIVGRGDSAALLAGATIAADEHELGESESNPRKLGLPRRVWGMGYEPRLIVDMESRSHGSLARLVDVMLAESLQLGAWIADDAALVGDQREERLTCHGTHVVVLDLRGARHVQGMLLGAHVSILLDGDAWLERPRALEAHGAALATPAAGSRAERDVDDAFDVTALCAALAESAKTRPETLVLRDQRRELTLTLDQDSALLPHADENLVAWSRVRLDVRFEP
jgi:hypothetical protein